MSRKLEITQKYIYISTSTEYRFINWNFFDKRPQRLCASHSRMNNKMRTTALRIQHIRFRKSKLVFLSLKCLSFTVNFFFRKIKTQQWNYKTKKTTCVKVFKLKSSYIYIQPNEISKEGVLMPNRTPQGILLND